MTDPNPLDGINPEHSQFLITWAAKHGAVVNFAGECGFGRECVGVLVGGSYLDYSHLYDLFRGDRARWAEWWAPEDAYHKHDCMAVLGRGPGAVEQLYQWAKFLDDHGWTVGLEARQPDSVLDAMLGGFSTAMLMPPAAETAPVVEESAR